VLLKVKRLLEKVEKIYKGGAKLRKIGALCGGLGQFGRDIFWVFWRKDALPPSKKQKIDYNQEKFILVHFH